MKKALPFLLAALAFAGFSYGYDPRQPRAREGGTSGALTSVSVTAGNGLSGSGTAGDPVVLAAAGAASAGAVTTGTQTLAGAKVFSTSVQSPAVLAGGLDAGSILSGPAYFAGNVKVTSLTGTDTGGGDFIVTSPNGTQKANFYNTGWQLNIGGGYLRGTAATDTLALAATNFTIGGYVDITDTRSIGSCTLNAASPSTCTATVVAAMHCTCSPVGTTAAIAAGGCAVSLSSTTLTITGPNGAGNAVNYHCL